MLGSKWALKYRQGRLSSEPCPIAYMASTQIGLAPTGSSWVAVQKAKTKSLVLLLWGRLEKIHAFVFVTCLVSHQAAFCFIFQLKSRGMCIKIVVRLSVIKVDTDMQCGEIHLGFSTETCNREVDRETLSLVFSFSISNYA